MGGREGWDGREGEMEGYGREGEREGKSYTHVATAYLPYMTKIERVCALCFQESKNPDRMSGDGECMPL